MPIQTYGLTPQRIGEVKGRILAHAMPQISLGTVGVKDDVKRRTGDVIKYRRYTNKGSTAAQPNKFFQDATGDRATAYANDHLTSEGVTSAPETLISQDITVTLKQYNVLYGYTDKTFDLYEDDIPKEMQTLTGERTGLICEMALFAVLKSCTNRFYGGSGVSRGTVNGVMSLPGLRRIARSLMANHALPVRNMFQRIAATGMYNTSPVPGKKFPVWCSTDLMPDLRDLPNFTPLEEYTDPSKAVENECGYCEEFRFISSPELVEIQDAGAAIAGTVPLLKSTTGTSADVYQVIVGSNDSWGHSGLEMQKKGAITAIPPSAVDKSDPQGQRGYVGSIFYYNGVILNQTQMAVYEVGTNALA